MTIDQTELVTNYLAGLQNLVGPGRDVGNARDYFVYTIAKLDGEPEPVDLYRGLAACEENGATAEQIAQMLPLVDSWGQLSVMAGEYLRSKGTQVPQDEELRAQPASTFTLGHWGITQKLTTPADLFAAAAVTTAHAGDYAAASSIIAAARARDAATEITDLVEAMIYFQASRWNDAITHASRVQKAADRSHTDQIVHFNGEKQVNVPIIFAAHVIIGTSWAHLDNREAADGALAMVTDSALAGSFPQLAAAAYRVRGLLERQRGDENAAQALFGRGLALSPVDELVTAQSDPAVGITVTSQEMIDRRTSYWRRDTEPLLVEAKAAEAGSRREQLLIEAREELAQQIGMAAVKDQVEQLAADVAFAQEMARRGTPLPGRTEHLAFSGPPGTGKTTVARIIAKFLAGYGVTATDKLVEAQRADLIAQYEGHTGKKTKAKIASALGGTLFIDEAYGLIHDRGATGKDSFGQEAVDELLIALEENRHELIVIIAGYEDELNRFIATNQGLQRRFSTWIQFESYTPDELAQITRVQAAKRHSKISDQDVDRLAELIGRKVGGMPDPSGRPLVDTLGNGGFARNIAEKAERFRSRRVATTKSLSELSQDELTTLTFDDLAQAVDLLVHRHGAK